jgi:hypothetical protein
MKRLFTSVLLGCIAYTASAQWNINTSVNLKVAPSANDGMEAVGTSDGKTWIAFYGHNNDIRVQLLDVAGNKLLGPDGVSIDSNPSGTEFFDFNVIVDHDNNLIIAAQDKRNASTMDAVTYKVNQVGISLWNGAAGVVLGAGHTPVPCVLNDGSIVFAWDNDTSLNMQRVSSTGTPVWTAPKVLSVNNGSIENGQLTSISSGGYVMVYQNASDSTLGQNSTLWAQRFNNNGDDVWSSAVSLSSESTTPYAHYSITQDADTTYFGYFTSGSNNQFHSWLQRINPDGSLPYGINGTAFANASATGNMQTSTNIALENNSPYVWAVCNFTDAGQIKTGVYIQKFNKSDGARLLSANGKEIYPINETSYAQEGSLTLYNDRPVFMVCSGKTYLIKGIYLDQNGNFILPNHDVELSGTAVTSLALAKGDFAFTKNVNGQSVALWVESRDTINVNYNGYAQNFNLNAQTGISTTERNVGISIFPNPASNILNLQMREDHPELKLTIADQRGRIVKSKTIAANTLNKLLPLNIQNLVPGVYILQLKGVGIKISKKFTKK